MKRLFIILAVLFQIVSYAQEKLLTKYSNTIGGMDNVTDSVLLNYSYANQTVNFYNLNSAALLYTIKNLDTNEIPVYLMIGKNGNTEVLFSNPVEIRDIKTGAVIYSYGEGTKLAGYITQGGHTLNILVTSNGLTSAKSLGIISSTSGEEIAFPQKFSLSQNYPNPFNPSTSIQYNLSQPGMASIKIYDINGRLVSTLVNDYEAPGVHNIAWDGKSRGGYCASGVYFCVLKTGNGELIKKMMMLK